MSDPDDANWLFDLSYSEHNLGWLDSKVGQPDSALAHYRRAARAAGEGPRDGADEGRSPCRAGQHV